MSVQEFVYGVNCGRTIVTPVKAEKTPLPPVFHLDLTSNFNVLTCIVTAMNAQWAFRAGRSFACGIRQVQVARSQCLVVSRRWASAKIPEIDGEAPKPRAVRSRKKIDDAEAKLPDQKIHGESPEAEHDALSPQSPTPPQNTEYMAELTQHLAEAAVKKTRAKSTTPRTTTKTTTPKKTTKSTTPKKTTESITPRKTTTKKKDVCSVITPENPYELTLETATHVLQCETKVKAFKMSSPTSGKVQFTHTLSWKPKDTSPVRIAGEAEFPLNPSSPKLKSTRAATKRKSEEGGFERDHDILVDTNKGQILPGYPPPASSPGALPPGLWKIFINRQYAILQDPSIGPKRKLQLMFASLGMFIVAVLERTYAWITEQLEVQDKGLQDLRNEFARDSGETGGEVLVCCGSHSSSSFPWVGTFAVGMVGGIAMAAMSTMAFLAVQWYGMP